MQFIFVLFAFTYEEFCSASKEHDPRHLLINHRIVIYKLSDLPAIKRIYMKVNHVLLIVSLTIPPYALQGLITNSTDYILEPKDFAQLIVLSFRSIGDPDSPGTSRLKWRYQKQCPMDPPTYLQQLGPTRFDLLSPIQIHDCFSAQNFLTQLRARLLNLSECVRPALIHQEHFLVPLVGIVFDEVAQVKLDGEAVAMLRWLRVDTTFEHTYRFQGAIHLVFQHREVRISYIGTFQICKHSFYGRNQRLHLIVNLAWVVQRTFNAYAF